MSDQISTKRFWDRSTGSKVTAVGRQGKVTLSTPPRKAPPCPGTSRRRRPPRGLGLSFFFFFFFKIFLAGGEPLDLPAVSVPVTGTRPEPELGLGPGARTFKVLSHA